MRFYFYVSKGIYDNYAAKFNESGALIEEVKHRPFGLYCWTSAFRKNGWYARIVKEADFTDQMMEKADIIHSNITSSDWDLTIRMRKRIEKSDRKDKIKFIGNIDYAVENWQQNFPEIDMIRSPLSALDHIFSVEPFQASIMTRLMDRPVSVIEHTGDIDSFKGYTVPIERRIKRIAVVYHPYLAQLEETIAICKKSGMPVTLVGYLPRKIEAANTMGQTSEHQVSVPDFFDEVVPRTDFIHYMRYIAESFIVVDPYRLHSVGRAGVECAALGVPFVSTTHVGSAVKCFPDTTSAVDDISAMEDLVVRLIEDEDFYHHVSQYAQKAVDEYNYDSQYLKMMKMTEMEP